MMIVKILNNQIVNGRPRRKGEIMRVSDSFNGGKILKKIKKIIKETEHDNKPK